MYEDIKAKTRSKLERIADPEEREEPPYQKPKWSGKQLKKFMLYGLAPALPFLFVWGMNLAQSGIREKDVTYVTLPTDKGDARKAVETWFDVKVMETDGPFKRTHYKRKMTFDESLQLRTYYDSYEEDGLFRICRRRYKEEGSRIFLNRPFKPDGKVDEIEEFNELGEKICHLVRKMHYKDNKEKFNEADAAIARFKRKHQEELSHNNVDIRYSSKTAAQKRRQYHSFK